MSLCYDSSSLGKDHFWRMSGLAMIMFVACLTRLVADVVYRAADARLRSAGPASPRQMWKIETVEAKDMAAIHRSAMILQWVGNVVCSVIFFACFVTSEFWSYTRVLLAC